MKIGVLTSSRADFGIYIPFLKKIESDAFFNLEIIAFGTHLSKKHGYTLNEIKKYSFTKIHQIETLPETDSPESISNCIGKTISKFSSFWNQNEFDIVICLGDRYEMFAAVSAGSPFNINFAHIHAGETTLGAIDNAYRHSISLFSKYLFVSNEFYKKRAHEISEENTDIFNVGALSIENLNTIDFLSKKEFLNKFNIDLNLPTILSTFHPETVSLKKNEIYIQELLYSFKELKKKYQIVITMPNTDTMGQMIRDEIERFKQNNQEIIIVESFGMVGYLTCMKYCSFLLGNTSSGFVEASYFPKFVINLGDRQKGRIETKNIFTIDITKENILNTVSKIEKLDSINNENIYGIGNTSNKIINILKSI